MENQEQIKEQAQNKGLDYVEITHGTNGYPSGLGEIAITGFDTFEQAQQFASSENCTVVCIRKKNGWHFWENMGPMYRALSGDDYLQDLGDNYNRDEFDVDFFAEGLQDLLTSFDGDFSDIDEYIENQKELQEATENLESDQIIITSYGKVFEVVNNEIMRYSEDVSTYQVAVLVEKDEPKDDEEW